MSDNKDLLKELPPLRHEFEISVKGQVTGKTYAGKFSFQIPTAGRRARADIERSTLNRGITTVSTDQMDREIIEEGALFNKMFAYLKHTLIETPSWWQAGGLGYDLLDPDPMISVYNECLSFEERWNKQVWGDGEQA